MPNTETANNLITDSEEQAELEQKFLTFWTDGELFGVPISDVVQIISMQGITPLPDFPAYAKGVINLRGDIIPVIDVRVRFGKPEVQYNENTCIIVTSIDENFMGFIVDSVDEVTDIDPDDISPAPKVSRDIKNKYLTGIGQVEEKVILLLDTAKILTTDEFEEVHGTMEEAEPVLEAASKKETAEKEAAKEEAATAPAPKQPKPSKQPKLSIVESTESDK